MEERKEGRKEERERGREEGREEERERGRKRGREGERKEGRKEGRGGERKEGREESVKGIGRVREGKGRNFIIGNQIDGWIHVLS